MAKRQSPKGRGNRYVENVGKTGDAEMDSVLSGEVARRAKVRALTGRPVTPSPDKSGGMAFFGWGGRNGKKKKK